MNQNWQRKKLNKNADFHRLIIKICDNPRFKKRQNNYAILYFRGEAYAVGSMISPPSPLLSPPSSVVLPILLSSSI